MKRKHQFGCLFLIITGIFLWFWVLHKQKCIPYIFVTTINGTRYHALQNSLKTVQLPCVVFVAPSKPLHLLPPLQNGNVFTKEDGSGGVRKHMHGTYSIAERSILATHLDILRSQPSDVFVILEDDIVLPMQFDAHIQHILSIAPPDFDLIQLFTTNRPLHLRKAGILEPFIKWMPHYWGAQGIIVRKTLYGKLSPFPLHAVSDFHLFHNVNSYTYTGHVFSTRRFSKNINMFTDHNFVVPAGLRKTDTNHVVSPHCNVHFIIAGFQTQPTIQSVTNNFPKHCKLTTSNTVQQLRQAKYYSWKSAMIPPHANWVLLSNDNIDFTMFPWLSFFLYADFAEIVGIPRASFLQNTMSHFKQDYWRSHKDPWKTSNPEFWDSHTISFMYDTSFVEQNVVMIKVACWNKIKNYTSEAMDKAFEKNLDYGIDLLWCQLCKCAHFALPVWQKDDTPPTRENSHANTYKLMKEYYLHSKYRDAYLTGLKKALPYKRHKLSPEERTIMRLK
jgi:GR25 family glycosyltransferase involved in LPS biosynthesis